MNVDGRKAHSSTKRLCQRNEIQGTCRKARGVSEHHQVMEKAARLGMKKVSLKKVCTQKSRRATQQYKRFGEQRRHSSKGKSECCDSRLFLQVSPEGNALIILLIHRLMILQEMEKFHKLQMNQHKTHKVNEQF